MPPVAPTPWVPFAIGGLAVLVALAWVAVARRAAPAATRRRVTLAVALALAAWLLATALLARSGVLARFEAVPPPFLLLVGGGVLATVAIGLSRLGRAAAGGVSLTALIGLQAFRLPLEIAMHRAALDGLMPVQMSWSGRNFDVVTGAGALGLALWLLLARPPRAVVWLWNLGGLALLANVVGVAIASLPRLHAFGTAPEAINTWVAFWPYVWLPTVLVPTALLGHILVTRRLLAER